MPAIFPGIRFWLKKYIMSDKNSLVFQKIRENIVKMQNNKSNFTVEDALDEFEELKKIALNCFDKNGNPNILAAIRAVENKAKIAGLYGQSGLEFKQITRMSEITIDGQQLKLNIGEEFNG